MNDARNTAPPREDERTKPLIPLNVGRFLQRAYGEVLDPPVIAVSLATAVGATLVYSVTGPLGRDDSFSTAQRLFLVCICTLIAWPFCHSLSAVVLYCSRRRKPYVIALLCIAKVPFMAMPYTAIAYSVFDLLGRNPAGRFWDIYFNATVWLAACCAVIHYTAWLRARLRHTDEAAADDVHASSEPRAPAGPAVARRPASFVDRLPEKLGRDVIYLNVSGHYVNAVTTEGSGVILMRFADAVAELGESGTQVHRSYWVAHRHITGIFRRDERTLVRVTGGHEVPVSRTYLTTVRDLIPRIAQGDDEHPGT